MSEQIIEPTSIGLSERNHSWLTRFKEEKVFSEMIDAYRFAFSYALSRGIVPDEIKENRKTTFSVSTFDPEKDIYVTLQCLMPSIEGPVYRMAERLADWGMTELVKEYQSGKLNLVRMIEQASKVT